MGKRIRIRPASKAGSLYSADKLVLARDLSLFLESSPVLNLPRTIRAIIVPHSAYLLSGGVAARAYRQLMEHSYEVAIIIASAQEEKFDFISIYSGQGFLTPLGNIKVDQELVDDLAFLHPDIQLSEIGYSPDEHSLEVQLPFLTWVQDQIPVVPIVMGAQSLEAIQTLHKALFQVLGEKDFVLIASSDLSHQRSDTDARSRDQIIISNIDRFESDRLLDDILDGRCEMSGFGPAIVAMRVAKEYGATEAKVLLYRNSGDITGDKSSVTGFLSAVIY